MKRQTLFGIIMVSIILVLNVYAEENSCGANNIDLKVDGYDADTKDTAYIVYAPGTFELTGEIENNLCIEEVEKDLDMVFILDASGSMQDEINIVKNSIKQIINKVNSECDGCARFGLYVLEGACQATGCGNLIKKSNYCGGGNDLGAYYLTDNGNALKKALTGIRASCSMEPWAYLTYNILEDSEFGWESGRVRAIVAITDAAANQCSNGLNKARKALKKYDAYFFGIYSKPPLCDPSGCPAQYMRQLLEDPEISGEMYEYRNPNTIPEKIMQAIHYIMGQDDFKIEMVEGPEGSGWDIDYESIVREVEREGGKKTFRIRLRTPQFWNEPVVWVRFRASVLGREDVYDDAWIKIVFNQPPVAGINVISPGIQNGTVRVDANELVVMDASATTDPDCNTGDLNCLEKELKQFEWDCENDGTIDYITTSLYEQVSCKYPLKNTLYEVKMCAYDKFDYNSCVTLPIQTNPNKLPDVNLRVISPAPHYKNTPIEFEADANDPDGYITKIEWDFDDGNIFRCVMPNLCFNIEHKFKLSGPYVVKVTVYDDDNESAEDSVTITVENRAPRIPKAEEIRVIPPEGIAPLHVIATVKNLNKLDPDGDPIVAFDWNMNGVFYYNQTTHSIEHVFPEPEKIYYVRVRVQDIEGAWSDWSEPVAVKTWEVTTVYNFDAEDVNLEADNKMKIKATCAGGTGPIKVQITDLNTGQIVYTSQDYLSCDGSYQTVDYNFEKPGTYMVRIFVENAPSDCVSCEAIKYITVYGKTQVRRVNENSVIVVIITVLITLLLARRTKN